MSSVTIDQMTSKLLTLDDVYEQLSETEPLVAVRLGQGTKVKFKMEGDWASDIDALDPGEAVPVVMSIDGVERQMTKESIFQAAGLPGLSAAYIRKTPAQYIERLLNYHYGDGLGSNEYNVLNVQDRVSAFTRPTLQPFSNTQLVESVVEGIQNHHGSDIPIFADYKFYNSLLHTNVRLIIPMTDRTIHDTGMSDVPSNAQDTWLEGIHLHNSVVGKGQTTLDSYLFRWWCTNGATTTQEDVGVWSRRVNGQQDDVYAWARDEVNAVIAGMEKQFDEVQALTRLNVAGNTADVLTEIFADYKIPVSQRDDIMAILLESENLTLYSVMQAITRVANLPDLDDKRRDRLMRTGGAIPTKQFDSLKARVWREGHTAPKTAPNPYDLAVA